MTRYEYNHNNLLLTGVTVTDQKTGVTLRTCYQYDIYGNRIGEISPNANLSSCPDTHTERPYLTATRYNLGRQVTGTIKPDPDGAGPLLYPATRNTYGTSGATRGLLLRVESGELPVWLNESVDPAAWDAYGFVPYLTREYTYDVYGRIRTEALIGADDVTEALTQYSYDDWGRVRCKAVRMNKNAYGSLPQSACDLGPEGDFGPDRIHRYTYDEFDQVLTEERAVGTSLAQTYVTNTYAGRGKLTSQTDANGNRTELRYDEGGLWRLQRRVHPSPTTPGTVNENDFNAYTYDLNGNVITEQKRNGTVITNTYDANNRLIIKDLSDNTYSPDVFYDYDLRGLQLHARFGSDSGPGVTNAFDGFGRLLSSTTDLGGVTRQLSYRYDLDGNRTRVTHPDESFTQNFSGTANDLTHTFRYNPASQIVQLTQSNSQYTYAETQSRVGAYIPNGLNQYTSIAGQTITYDANGNLTGDGTLTYTYDMENRLVATGGSVASSLTYDPVGRLFQLTVGGTTTQFLYDGDALVAEYQGGTLTRRYVHGDRVDEPWVQYNGTSVGAGSRRFLHADHLGSIIAHSDSSGSVLNKLAYDSYGIPAAGNIDRFGFTGQAWLKDLGLFHYVRHRTGGSERRGCDDGRGCARECGGLREFAWGGRHASRRWRGARARRRQHDHNWRRAGHKSYESKRMGRQCVRNN